MGRMSAMSRMPPASSSVPPDVASRMQAELEPGEKLVWLGQPLPRLMARRAWLITLFGIPFTAFAAFWIVMAGGAAVFTRDIAPGGGPFRFFGVCFPLFGLPFLVVGVGMLFAPLWARRTAARTAYALTDRRAIVRRGRAFGSVDVRSYRPQDLPSMSRHERADGSGDLVFQEVYSSYRDSDGDRHTRHQRFGFIGVENVRAVEDLVRKTLLSQ